MRDMRDPDLDDRDHLTRFAAHHRDVFNKEILSRMKTPRRACPCGRPDEVPSCRIHYAVLRAVNRTFRKLLPPYEEVMATKNELVARDLRTGRPGFLKRDLQRYVCMLAAPEFTKDVIGERRSARSDDLKKSDAALCATVKETLDDLAAGRENLRYKCEVCGKRICVFCGAACGYCLCRAVRTCRECAETYVNFISCNSCKLTYCKDNERCGGEIVYCSVCHKFICPYVPCENGGCEFCEICHVALCWDCELASETYINCDRCFLHFMCEDHNTADQYLTYVGDDDDYPHEYFLCESCLKLPPGKSPFEKPPQPPIEKPKSPSVSPRTSFSSPTDDTDGT